MKICIPAAGNTRGRNEEVHGHFGSAPYLAVADTETGAVEFRENGGREHEHGHCNPVASITGTGVKAVVAGGMGFRAIELLRIAGISVYRADSRTVGETLDLFTSGKLEAFPADCGCSGHGQGHGCC